jgi:DNA-binding transcriptional regulator LsrR (DeoR family)
MSQEGALGPAALVLTASIARRYYFEGASKSLIADELNLSRFKVARLLEQARSSGLVRIEIDYRGEIDLDLSVALRTAYGLRHCVVVSCPGDDPAALRTHLGRAGAGLLTEIVDADDVLGLVWARSLLAMRSALQRLARCAVVQLTGALATADDEASAVELVRDVARISRGPASYFYAPMIVPDMATAQALRAQPEIARALGRVPEVTKAVVGVGAWAAGQSTVADAVSPREREEMHALGVRAEVGGIQLDAEGRPVRTSLTDRLIGIEAEDLRAVPEVVGIVYGASKAGAVQAALRGGFVKSLVTHSEMADALLERA